MVNITLLIVAFIVSYPIVEYFGINFLGISEYDLDWFRNMENYMRHQLLVLVGIATLMIMHGQMAAEGGRMDASRVRALYMLFIAVFIVFVAASIPAYIVKSAGIEYTSSATVSADNSSSTTEQGWSLNWPFFVDAVFALITFLLSLVLYRDMGDAEPPKD
jgi:hypothetical protein